MSSPEGAHASGGELPGSPRAPEVEAPASPAHPEAPVPRRPLGLFEAYGVEVELMLVDRDGLAVLPAVDRLLRLASGGDDWVTDVERAGTEWSNELVLHVVELKTAGPAPDLEAVPQLFARDVAELASLARRLGGRLLPTGMHPFMDPDSDTRLWPHDFSPVYQAFDRIFGCRGHGWSNLQSCHLNLPFDGDEEFGRLHAAVRLVLPLLPALAASSPVTEGRIAGRLDQRLESYRTNSRSIPEVAGEIVPEPVWSREAYEREILKPAYAAVAPRDPEGVLQAEFLNARGAIARFGRGSLEVRLLDTQEHPGQDLAVVALVVAVLRLLVEQHWCSLEEQQAWAVAPLAALFRRALTEGEAAEIADPAYLALFGVRAAEAPLSAGELWRRLAWQAREVGFLGECWREGLEVIFRHGTLARRILRALGKEGALEKGAQEGGGPVLGRRALVRVYRRLADCLEAGEPFLP